MRKNNLGRPLKIIAGCQDPGGCNAILPVVNKLRLRGDSVRFLASGHSAALLRKKNIAFSEILKQNPTSIEKFFFSIKPDIVLVGTSLGYSLEDVLVMQARKRNIPSIAVLDSWVSYYRRFSGLSSGEKFRYLSDIVCVMDEVAKYEMINEGVPSDKIEITGNPYFDNFRDEIRGYLSGRSVFLEDRGLTSDALIMSFISQRIDRSFGDNDKNSNFLGYTQFDALRMLIKAVSGIKKDKGLKTVLIVRPHPKEKPDRYNFLRKEENGIFLIVDNENEHRKLLAISDIVCGMFSSVLIEAHMFGKKIISIQPNLSKNDPFVLSRLGVVNTVRTLKELKKQLKLFFSGNNNKACFSLPKIIQSDKAANNIIKLMEYTAYNHAR